MKIQFITVETSEYSIADDADKTVERHYRPEHIIHACADFQYCEETDRATKLFLTYEMKYAMGDDNLPYYTRQIPSAQASVMCAILKDSDSDARNLLIPDNFLDYMIRPEVFEAEFCL